MSAFYNVRECKARVPATGKAGSSTNVSKRSALVSLHYNRGKIECEWSHLHVSGPEQEACLPSAFPTAPPALSR